MLAEGGKEFVVPELVLVADHLDHVLPDGLEGLARAHAVGAGVVGLVLDLLLDASDADFEKFVEVGGDDAEKADALEERLGGVLRLFQDAAVEGEPAQFAVDEESGSERLGVVMGAGEDTVSGAVGQRGNCDGMVARACAGGRSRA